MLNQDNHKKIMFEILRDIYQSDLGLYLGFKGGTMLYFFYGLDRFSVDLDFDLLNETKKDYVLKRIGEIIRPYGKIDDLSDKRYTVFALLNYGFKERNLKIEISKRPDFLDLNHYELENFYGVDVRCMNIKDAFAHKLVASTNRRSMVNRDFYDVYFFFKNGIDFNKEIIEKSTGKSSIDYLKFLRKYIEKNLNQRNILQGLGEVLDEKRKIWVKANLKQELINYINFYLEQRNMK